MIQALWRQKDERVMSQTCGETGKHSEGFLWKVLLMGFSSFSH